jgi:hypothetical protein
MCQRILLCIMKDDENDVKTSWGMVAGRSAYDLPMTTSSASRHEMMLLTTAETYSAVGMSSTRNDVSRTAQELATTNINTNARAVTNDISRLKRSVDDVTLTVVDGDFQGDVTCMTAANDPSERVCLLLLDRHVCLDC